MKHLAGAELGGHYSLNEYVVAIDWEVEKGFPGNSAGEESACSAGDPGSGRPPAEEFSSIFTWRIPMDRGGAWRATIHGVA